MSNPWFYLHTDILNDEKIISLTASDRWYFIAIMSLKCDGMLDKYEGDSLQRKVALRLRISAVEAAKLKRRLTEEGLIDEDWQPVDWGLAQ